MELQVQQFLRNGGTLMDLCKPPYSLKVRQKDNLVLLKYTQGVSDGFNPIVNECRGIILDSANNWDVVCFPFTRFYNVGQPEAAQLGKELRVYSKEDGSYVKLYYYHGEWYCASNTTIDACDTLIDGKYNFFELVCKALETYGYTWEDFTSLLNSCYTYMFELVCPETRQVVNYGDVRKLYYLGERDKWTFEERYAPYLPVDNVRQYSLMTMTEIQKAVEELGDNAEGFVVVDENWNRVKVKSSNYFKLHYAANNGKPNCYELILNGEDAEFLAYFPWYEKQFDNACEALKEIEKTATQARENTSYCWELPRRDFVAAIDMRSLFTDFVLKCYNDHSLEWKEYVKDWDWAKWKGFLKKWEENQ